MSDTERFKEAERLAAVRRLDGVQQFPDGRVEYDELGNAVWVPVERPDAKEAARILLDDQKLELKKDEATGMVMRIQPNPGGLNDGYDPYDSGVLGKKRWKPKKDLRALSHWIEQKKKPGDGE